MIQATRTTPGTVYLVGAGPGDPGLLTLRAARCLKLADVVIYDYLVNPAALEHVSPSAELICLGHHSSGRDLSPDEIVELMLEEARLGKTVTRLKGGDPSVFGRGADEVRALREDGIPHEIVPGITAGIAVAAYCEIPITHHDDASAVALIAGQERHSKAASSLDYGVLAHFPGTLIFYMGVRKASQWSRALMENGKPPETPVGIVRWCTRAQQQTVRCTLETVTDAIETHGIRPPSLFVVGKVVDRAPELSWFTARPLMGRRVLVDGSPDTSGELRSRLAALGADVITQPPVRVTDPPDWGPVDAALERLDRYDWLLFSSRHGVTALIRRLLDRGEDLRRLGSVKLAVVGTDTQKRLRHYHLNPDLVIEPVHDKPLPSSLGSEDRDRRILLARSSQGRRWLVEALQQTRARVDPIVVYGRADLEAPNTDVVRELSSGEIHWITATSPDSTRSLVRLYGDALGQARIASIGPATSAALRDHGLEAAVEATPGTTAGLVEAILRTEQGED